MADKKISQLPAATLPLAGTELLPIVQSGTTDNITVNNLAAGNIKSNATTGVLQVTGPAAGATRVMTTPDADFTVARIDAANSFTADQTLSTGNLVIGTSGKGINFASSGGDVLAYYDEGSFTPTLLSGTCTGTAYYTRIGRQVSVFGTISYATDGSGGVGVTIGNMPFAAAQAVRGFAGWSGIALDAGDTQAACYMASGSDDLVFLGYPSDSGINASRWLAGAVLSFNITYIV